jgi:hypothetical protein
MKTCGLPQGSILLIIQPDKLITAYTLATDGLSSCPIDDKTSIHNYLSNITTFHLTCSFKLQLPAAAITGDLINENLCKLIYKCIMWLPEENMILHEDDDNRSHKFKPTGFVKPCVNVKLLRSGASEGSTVHPPVVTVTPLTTPLLVLPVSLSVVGVFSNDEPLSDIASQLKDRTLSQINLIADTISSNKMSCSVSLHHYMIPSQHVPVTVAYPHLPMGSDGQPVSDGDLKSVRSSFHDRFCLPTTVPFLRKSNRQWSPWKQESIVVNPHSSLKFISIGEVATVSGSYGYYHYMQDNFDDNGWGCAYRSLQTIWSWYIYQGYTTLPVPSHRQIQQTLVDCGDKSDQSFIGSTQWIGSIEVSNVLNHCLEVDCRIHHCASGGDIAGTGQLLLRHFQTQGTPVMIGGGVLAHTILGVDYDMQSGNIKFLILDPHYTGSDDIKQILNKWCGWKSMSFWDSSARYNMCLPLKLPNQI